MVGMDGNVGNLYRISIKYNKCIILVHVHKINAVADGFHIDLVCQEYQLVYLRADGVGVDVVCWGC